MKILKSIRAWLLVGTSIFLFVVCPSSAKEVYKWVDEERTVHFSEDESSIPEACRGRAEKKSLSEEVGSPEEKATPKKQEGKKTKERPAGKQKEGSNKNRIEGDVVESIKTILSLWKNGRYDLLYDWGDQKSRAAVNREDFEHRMRKKGIGLSSSWETMQDIQVDVKSATLAYTTVKIGYKLIREGETKFRTETYRMSLEKGMWKISLAKLLSVKIYK